MAGNIESKTNIKGVGDFLGKAIKGSVTSESTVKQNIMEQVSLH